MAFQKGQSGNPGGRQKDKPWADALRLAVFREDAEGKRRLLAIAEKCAAAAESGDMQAIKEIGDRLDGKPAQESTVTIDDKRDATDWTRGDLVAFLHDARASSNGAAKANGRASEPDSVH
jgi:hypothetical protein